jgi:hypothetical protein
MPVCKLCKRRIDLTKKFERVYKCSKCGNAVCKDQLCYACAGKDVTPKRRSFVRQV